MATVTAATATAVVTDGNWGGNGNGGGDVNGRGEMKEHANVIMIKVTIRTKMRS